MHTKTESELVGYWNQCIKEFKNKFPVNNLITCALGLMAKWEYEMLYYMRAITQEGYIVCDGWVVRDAKDYLLYEGNDYNQAKEAKSKVNSATISNLPYLYAHYLKYKKILSGAERDI